jgi:ACS family tartrate transporter-like MFS transporter
LASQRQEEETLMMGSPETAAIVAQTRRKITWRILPFVFVLYIIAYLDRANVAFAKVPMSADLGFSEAVFGFGAGIFFLGYFLLEIPGALIVEHWSARRWIARILVSWGVCTILVGLVRSDTHFYLARFLLGAAEAGFFPGIIVYLTHWFTVRDRARAMAGFVMAAPISLTLGAPLSALILRANWWGLPGWRWVFILEGLPAILFGVITLFYLTDRPRQATWLSRDEQEWIRRQLDDELVQKRSIGPMTLRQGLQHPKVLLLSFALLFANIGGYGFVLSLPSTLQKLSGGSASFSSAYSALPFGLAVLSVFFMGRSSDRSGERKLHTAIPMLLAGLFLALSALPSQPFPLLLLWLSLAGASAYGWNPCFWVLPTLVLGESAAAASIGLINSVGNLGGFVGPSVLGLIASRSGSYPVAVVFLSLCYFAGAALVIASGIRHDRGSSHAALIESKHEITR